MRYNVRSDGAGERRSRRRMSLVTLKIDRRVLYLLAAVLGLALPLGLGLWLGRGSAPQAPEAAGVPTLAAGPTSAFDITGSLAGQATVVAPTQDPALANLPRVTVDEAYQQFQDGSAVFVDARQLDYFNQGHIPGAVSIPETEAAARYTELPTDKDIIVYCA
jgi:hypothetical protein